MNVPTDKIFMMLSYAAGYADLTSLESVGAAGAANPSNYLGKMLAEAGERSLRAGLPQHYSPRRIKGRSLRGRIDFPRQIRTDQFGGIDLCCIADGLGHGTTSVRLIKTAALHLSRSEAVSDTTANRLTRLARSLHCDPLPTLSSRMVDTFQASRVPDIHRAAAFVAWLALSQQGFDSRDSGAVFGWPHTPQQLGGLFQEFVRQKLTNDSSEDIDVGSDTYALHLAAGVGTARAILPQLRTDIVLANATDVVVVEVKLMPPLIGGAWPSSGTQRLRADHLSQLLAYLEHAASRYCGRRIRGLLLYGAVNPRVCARFPLSNFEVGVSSLDFRDSCERVLADLSRIAAFMQCDDALGIGMGECQISTSQESALLPSLSASS